jgi:adenylate cyclase
MVGYSRLIGLDDAGTLQRLRALRGNLIDPAIAENGGRIVQTGGDSLLIVFDSIDGAVRCAVKVQQQVPAHDGDQPADRAIRFRVGIDLGDAIADGTDLHGDAVNVAARLQAECPPGRVCVSRSVRDHVHGRLGLTFRELGPLSLKNIAQRVEAFVVSTKPAAAPESVEPLAVGTNLDQPPVSDKPSLAVLAFQNMSGDPEQEYFSDGMVEEIITALARISGLFVAARNSSFRYKGQAVDIRQVGNQLGVRYVLEGSVRKAGNRVRITAQLIDAVTDAHIWADRFDGALDDIFELQDQVASSVAGAIEPALVAAEVRRSALRPTNDLTAYDLYLRALALANSWEKEAIIQALNLLEQAIERDPRYGVAMIEAAARNCELHQNGWTDDPEATCRKGIALCQQALQVAADDPNVLSRAGFLLGYFGDDIEVAIGFVDRSLKLNPNAAAGWRWSAWLRLWAGQPDLAINHFETSLRLNPHMNRPNAFMGIGVGHFFARRLEEARRVLLQSLQEKPNWVPTHRFLASCYAHMGRLKEAKRTVARLRTLTNVVIPSAEHWRDPAQREFYLAGLRLAVENDTDGDAAIPE